MQSLQQTIETILQSEFTNKANLIAMLSQDTPAHPYEVGKVYFCRTITFYYIGELVGVYPSELVLKKVSWILDTGRFNEAMKTGVFSEVEPFPSDQLIILNRSAIVDISIMKNVTLPLTVK